MTGAATGRWSRRAKRRDLSLDEWLVSCRVVLDRYFTLEDPRRLEPADRELYVEALLDSKLLLRGFVDRIDVAPNGMIRVVDYKTGRSPGEMFEAKALFQMKFYALVIWRTRGVIPSMLQLIYLGNGEVLRYKPDERDLIATERKVEAIWRAIRIAEETGDWRPHKSRLCGWCAHRAICPEWGGTPPPLPVASAAAGRLPTRPATWTPTGISRPWAEQFAAIPAGLRCVRRRGRPRPRQGSWPGTRTCRRQRGWRACARPRTSRSGPSFSPGPGPRSRRCGG